MKTCIDCHKEKTNDSYCKHGKTGTYYSRCKECLLVGQRAARKAKEGMSYKDYLEQAGLEAYYKKTLRYQI